MEFRKYNENDTIIAGFGGCCGAWPAPLLFNYIRDHGIVYEACFEFDEYTTSCGDWDDYGTYDDITDGYEDADDLTPRIGSKTVLRSRADLNKEEGHVPLIHLQGVISSYPIVYTSGNKGLQH